jgi:hypothetical protein
VDLLKLSLIRINFAYPINLPKSTACFFNILEKKMPGGVSPPENKVCIKT